MKKVFFPHSGRHSALPGGTQTPPRLVPVVAPCSNPTISRQTKRHRRKSLLPLLTFLPVGTRGLMKAPLGLSLLCRCAVEPPCSNPTISRQTKRHRRKSLLPLLTFLPVGTRGLMKAPLGLSLLCRCAVEPPCSNPAISRQTKRHRLASVSFLAEMVGFEPTCPIKDKTISSRSRYDHFDTSPYDSLYSIAKKGLCVNRFLCFCRGRQSLPGSGMREFRRCRALFF